MKKLFVTLLILSSINQIDAACDGTGIKKENPINFCTDDSDCSPGRCCSVNQRCQNCKGKSCP